MHGALLFALACRSPAPGPSQPNIVMLVWETTRADHVSALGYPLRTTPTMELVAAEGVSFSNTTSAAPWTLPSVSSLMTGVSPTAHGVREFEDALSPANQTLAEQLQAAGYHTALLGVNSLFEADRGLDQGFDFYFGQDSVPGLELSQRMLRWLDERPRDQPFFLYLHIFEPHCPYDPPLEYEGVFEPRPPELATGRVYDQRYWDQMFGCFRLPAPGRAGGTVLDVDAYLSAYDAELHYTDHLTSTMLQRMETRGLLDDTLLLFLGDHGEEFLEHGDHGHGRHLYQESVHVPLIVRPPGTDQQRARFAGTRVDSNSSTLDVTATVLAAAGIDAQTEGLDLSPAWRGGAPRAWARRPVFSGTDHEAHLRSVRQGDWKLIVDVGRPEVDPDLPQQPVKVQAPELYDLSSDPLEQTNLAGDQPERVTALLALIEQNEARGLERAEAVGRSRRPLDEDTQEALRRLGYLD